MNSIKLNVTMALVVTNAIDVSVNAHNSPFISFNDDCAEMSKVYLFVNILQKIISVYVLVLIIL